MLVGKLMLITNENLFLFFISNGFSAEQMAKWVHGRAEVTVNFCFNKTI